MNGLSTVAAVREFTILLSVILGGFLCWSAYHKLVRPRAFIVTASAYRPLSPRAAQGVGLAVPICELVLGTALVVGVAVRVAALSAGLLFALFAVAMGYNLARGNIIPCGCHGTTQTRTIGIVPIVEDAALVALAAGLAVATGTWDVVPSWSPFAHDLVQPWRAGVASLLVLVISAAMVLMVFGREEPGSRGFAATKRMAGLPGNNEGKTHVYR